MITSTDYPNIPLMVIRFNELWHECSICGIECPSRFSIPVCAFTGIIVDNDYGGEWAGRSTCEDCYKKHGQGDFVGYWTCDFPKERER